MAARISSFSLNLPFGIGGINVEMSEQERHAAWDLYVEYSTRVSTQRLEHGTGSAREALDSIYKLFEITREILKEAGPSVSHGPNSLGPLAIRVLNEPDGLRSFLTEWHGELGGFEDQQRIEQREFLAPGVDAIIDESTWKHRDAFYTDLNSLRDNLSLYVEALAELAGAKTAK